MKHIVIEVSDEDAETIIFNDKHGNAQAIVDAGEDGMGFDVVRVAEPGEIS